MPFDFCNPTIKVGIEKVPCVDEKGRENHVLVMHIDASPQVHANQADDVFLRVGDKSKLQTFEERLQLNYDKGERYFEDKAVPDATIDDIDMDFVKEYTDKIDYGKSPLEYLKENRGFIKEKMARFKSVPLQFCYLERIRKISFLVQGFVLYVMREPKKNLEQR